MPSPDAARRGGSRPDESPSVLKDVSSQPGRGRRVYRCTGHRSVVVVEPSPPPQPRTAGDASRSDAVLVVSRHGFVKFVSEHARALVAAYVAPITGDWLPPSLVAWLAQSGRGMPFVAEQDGRRLLMRPLPTSDPGEIVL